MNEAPSLPVRRALFVATILVGSFLLFLVQPLVARMALPLLGGAPNVWNSAMLVYQALLLGGYAYAHALARFPIRRQAAIHLILLALAALTLPIALVELAPPAPGWEPLWVPALLALTVGPLFFLVSAQAPLMQRWYASNEAAGDPYWLYAASNIGSFTGLICYPLFFEPNLPIGGQSLAWAAGYALLIVLVGLAAASRWRAGVVVPDEPELKAEGEAIGWKRVALWLALAAVPSGLMLSTTTHLTTDIVAMPLLWVVPLGLYLLSYVFAFNERSHLGAALARSAPTILLLAGALAMVSRGADSLSTALATVLMLFVVAVALHRRLYFERPSPSHLTFFYLVMSAGGALGGLFTALIAPVIFDWVWEHPLLVLAAAALLPNRPLFPWMERLGFSERNQRLAVLGILLATILLGGRLVDALETGSDGLVLALMLAMALCGLAVLGKRWAFLAVLVAMMLSRGGYETIRESWEGARDRSYFGIYTVQENEGEGVRRLTHGTTLHGKQFIRPERRLEPTTYYGSKSGVGLAMLSAPSILGEEAHIGVVGLGVGTLACYKQPGQSWEFFEIDPQVYDYSLDGSFTFLDECTPDAPVHIGDARLVLEDMADNRFDVLAIDAFSSDAIPLHLLTEEAVGIYGNALAEDGLLLMHISNRYIDLAPMIAALAQKHGMVAMRRVDDPDPVAGTTGSNWVALSRDPETLAKLVMTDPEAPWRTMPPPAERAWTDDFASILPFLSWRNVLGVR